MKKLFIVSLALLLCSCNKVENPIKIKDCSITYYFNRVDTKGRTNASERSYSKFCYDIDEFIEKSEKMFNSDEPTATKVSYKTKIN